MGMAFISNQIINDSLFKCLLYFTDAVNLKKFHLFCEGLHVHMVLQTKSLTLATTCKALQNTFAGSIMLDRLQCKIQYVVKYQFVQQNSVCKCQYLFPPKRLKKIVSLPSHAEQN